MPIEVPLVAERRQSASAPRRPRRPRRWRHPRRGRRRELGERQRLLALRRGQSAALPLTVVSEEPASPEVARDAPHSDDEASHEDCPTASFGGRSRSDREHDPSPSRTRQGSVAIGSRSGPAGREGIRHRDVAPSVLHASVRALSHNAVHLHAVPRNHELVGSSVQLCIWPRVVTFAQNTDVYTRLHITTEKWSVK